MTTYTHPVEEGKKMNDIYPKTGRTYDCEATIQVLATEDFDIENLGETWSLTDFGVAVVNRYKELVDEM